MIENLRYWTAAALAWLGDRCLRLSDRLVPFEVR